MSKLELTVPARVYDEIDRLVERGEFLNREQAVEELLTMGVSVYDTDAATEEETDEEIFTQTADDQQDPARLDDEPDDEYTL